MSYIKFKKENSTKLEYQISNYNKTFKIFNYKDLINNKNGIDLKTYNFLLNNFYPYYYIIPIIYNEYCNNKTFKT